MADFNVEFAEGQGADSVDSQITSKSLCTPGCIDWWVKDWAPVDGLTINAKG